MSSTVADDVAAFLKKNKPKAYCDDCLATAVKAKRRQQVNQATSGQGTAGFVRMKRPCAACSKTKLATSA